MKSKNVNLAHSNSIFPLNSLQYRHYKVAYTRCEVVGAFSLPQVLRKGEC